MKIELRDQVFDPYAELTAYQTAMERHGQYGATACFVGSMRDFNDGERIEGMNLEYYPGMAEKHLREICDKASQRWALLDALVIHRVGRIRIGESIVLVAVWSAHRGDAFDACRFIMEDLKHSAPFWKKEQLHDHERWVEKNTDGYAVKSTN